jgi:hypothetical protein
MPDLDRASSSDLDPVARPPTRAGVIRVRDVLIVKTSDGGTFDEFQAHPPAGDPPSPLGRDAFIEQLDGDEAELVVNACEPRGHYYYAQRQYGARYAFVRNLDRALVDPNPYGWDPEGVLWPACVMSRFVVDNAYSTEYAARVVDYEDGEQQVIPVEAVETDAIFRFDTTARDWLDAREAAELAQLLDAFWAKRDNLHDRVRLALWLSAYANHGRWLDYALPFLVAALEALLNTDNQRTRRQFIKRVSELSDELGMPLTGRFCGKVYDARSQGFHGSHVSLLHQDGLDRAIARAVALQNVLRATLRRAIEDSMFEARFESADTVRTHWPVRGD